MVAMSTEITFCPASGRSSQRSTRAAQPATAASVQARASQVGRSHITRAV